MPISAFTDFEEKSVCAVAFLELERPADINE
jgi:hypothetical protein